MTGTTMQVPLAPNYRPWRNRDVGRALAAGPLLIRGRGGYRQHEPRWHRPRSGTRYAGHTSWQFWCGQASGKADLLFSDTLPDGETICGACEGRAMGAGWPPATLPAGDYPLIFTPPSIRPPLICPGSYDQHSYVRTTNWWTELPGSRAVTCLFCGSVQPIRGGYHGLNWRQPGPARHEPHQLIDPCPEHGWFSMVHVDDQFVCRCRCVEVATS